MKALTVLFIFSNNQFITERTRYQKLNRLKELATESELTDITIKNVLTYKIYNDLGFLLGENL